MRVNQLNMTSFRGIGDLKLDFSEHAPTVFIGDNGVGKSSILDCLAILLSWFINRMQFDPNSKTILISKGVDGTVNERELADGRYFSDRDIKNKHNQTNNQIKISLNYEELEWSVVTLQKTGKNNTDSKLENLNKVTKKLRNEWNSNPKANIPLAIYYPVNRSVLDIPLELTQKDRFEQINAYEQALEGLKISFDSFFRWFRLVEDLKNEDRRDNPDYRNHQLEAVKQAISSLMPDF